MSRVKNLPTVVFVGSYLTVFEMEKEPIAEAFLKHFRKIVEVKYLSPPHYGENFNEFLDKIRNGTPLFYSIVLESLFLSNIPEGYFEKKRILNTRRLFSFQGGLLYQVQSDGTLLKITETDPQLIVAH